MGGNAIKNVEVRRIPRDEYFALTDEVLDKLKSQVCFQIRRTHLIESYSEKADFGDADFLVEKPALGKWRPEHFTSVLPSKEVVVNGEVISMEYKGFQLDFIQVPSEEFKFAKIYFSFNDLGNLLGKTARNLGLKYGHQGLVYTLRDGLGDKVGQVTVTRDPKVALEFLGYDWNRYQRGFKNLEEIFEFVVSSKYFNADVYALERLSHVDRIRDRKRATYQAFLEWLPKKGLTGGFEQEGGPKAFLPEIRKAFPEFAMEYDLTLAKKAKAAAAKLKFNGNIVAELTGLKTEKLGMLMAAFRRWFKTEDSLFDYVLHVSQDELNAAIIAMSNKYGAFKQ